MDLLERNYNVHVLADGVSSRTMVERMFALEVRVQHLLLHWLTIAEPCFYGFLHWIFLPALRLVFLQVKGHCFINTESILNIHKS